MKYWPDIIVQSIKEEGDDERGEEEGKEEGNDGIRFKVE